MAIATRVTELTRPDEPPGDQCERVIIRPLPKIALFWPVLVCALLCTLGMYLSPEYARGWGRTFQTVFFLNVFVMAFDFTAVAAMALIMFVVAVGLLASLVEYRLYDYLPLLAGWLDEMSPRANIWFYALIATGLVIVFAGIWLVSSRFNYWEVTHNEIVHHVGVRDEVRRYSTEHLRMQKEITDVFELALLRSGRLVFYAAGMQEAIVLENVRGINGIELRIQELLQAIRVEDTTPETAPSRRLDPAR